MAAALVFLEPASTSTWWTTRTASSARPPLWVWRITLSQPPPSAWTLQGRATCLGSFSTLWIPPRSKCSCYFCTAELSFICNTSQRPSLAVCITYATSYSPIPEFRYTLLLSLTPKQQVLGISHGVCRRGLNMLRFPNSACFYNFLPASAPGSLCLAVARKHPVWCETVLDGIRVYLSHSQYLSLGVQLPISQVCSCCSVLCLIDSARVA